MVFVVQVYFDLYMLEGFVFYVYCVVIYLLLFFIFFFKQKTAYEMRISDWSSDVCSSDLHFAHSLLNIGHYLMSMGLYTSSNKVEETRVQRHMTFFACVLTHDFTAFCLVNLLIATVDPTRSEERRVG